MSDRRILATVADELDLVRVLRARIEEINVSRRELSVEAGLTESYAEKLLCMPPMLRYFGPRAFWNICESLGLAVALIEDPNATERFAKRMAKRDNGKAHKRTKALVASGRIPWLINSGNARRLGEKGAQARNAQLSPSRRRKIARRAAIIRWERVKQAVKA